jgi:hypothetical protein
MTTPLEKTLKRELRIRGRPFIVAISPEALKLTLKGKRKGLELPWEELVSGEAALAVALNASIGKFTAAPASPKKAPAAPAGPKKAPAVPIAPPKRSATRPAAKRRV